MKRMIFSFILPLFIVSGVAVSAEVTTVDLKKDEKCAVCGMFVAKYKTWIAQIHFSDGSHAVFDGPKDMFKYYLNMSRYSPSKKPSDIVSVSVTEYYSAKLMDAKKMFYVTGSDVRGPMGDELVPLASERQAREFLRDHRGTGILTFPEITNDHLMRSHER